jgi:hypothetical protein
VTPAPKPLTLKAMRSRFCVSVALLFASALPPLQAGPAAPQVAPAKPYETVLIDPVKTSIYVGSVTLRTTPMKRAGDVYTADYTAKVFPYFFENEKGKLWITITDEDLSHLEKGQAVFFKGHAENADHEPRRIEGRALPADAKHGKIKVRVFVTQKIQLIFNAEYRFGQ